MESANCKRNLQIVSGFRKFMRILLAIFGFGLQFAESTYNLRNPLTVAESRTTSYILMLRESANKQMCRQFLRYRYWYAESTEMFWWNPLKFWNMFKKLFPGIQEHTDTKLCTYPVHSLASQGTVSMIIGNTPNGQKQFLRLALKSKTALCFNGVMQVKLIINIQR